MPLLALLALFIVVPLAELYVILKVGDAIGVLPTIPLLRPTPCSDRCCSAPRGAPSGALQRDDGGRPRAAPRAARRRAGHLRRRLPDHPRSSPTSSALLLLLPPTRSVIRRLVVRAARAPHHGRSAGRALRRRRQRHRVRRPRQAAGAVSAGAFALSFFDLDRELYGTARSGSDCSSTAASRPPPRTGRR